MWPSSRSLHLLLRTTSWFRPELVCVWRVRKSNSQSSHECASNTLLSTAAWSQKHQHQNQKNTVMTSAVRKREVNQNFVYMHADVKRHRCAVRSKGGSTSLQSVSIYVLTYMHELSLSQAIVYATAMCVCVCSCVCVTVGPQSSNQRGEGTGTGTAHE